MDIEGKVSKSIGGLPYLLETLVIDDADHQVHQDHASKHDENKEHNPARGWQEGIPILLIREQIAVLVLAHHHYHDLHDGPP